MTDRNFKPDSGTDLVFEDAGSTDRLRITDGGATILYDEGGSAALSIDTNGHTSIGDSNYFYVREIRAKDGNGLKLYDDSGAAGIFVEDGGEVGIGTESPSAKLHVDGGGLTITDDGDHVRLTMDCSAGTGRNWQFQSRNNGYFWIRDDDAGANRLTIDTSGDFTGSASADISDQRLKENINDITNSLEKINQLRGVSYTWKKEANKNTNVKYLGLLAQEVEKVVPDVVVNRSICDVEPIYWEETDKLPSGVKIGDLKTEEKRYKSLHYTGLIPVLVEAVKELSTKVTALESA
jgi:hypothetical protein